jgi:probable F420-dependent oxidoreductase
MSRPKITFGLDVPAETVAGDPVANARRAEELGFDFVSTNDHVLGRDPRNEGWTLLTWLAASTSRIRLASRVIGVPYREPALLAKMAETLARLSGGRLILGLGAGSGEGEFRAMGLAPSTVRDRVDALDEAIQVITSLWEQASVNFTGNRYVIRDATIEPKPERHIPIWLGTAGPRGLKLLGERADGWIPSLAYAPPNRAPSMIADILAAAERLGRDPAQIERIYNLEISMIDGVRADLVGRPEQIGERLVGFARLGFTGFNFQPVGPAREDQVEWIAREVIPIVRGAVG